ncbi:MAG: type II/IV secretion system protein [Gemmatimonadota bacterium]
MITQGQHWLVRVVRQAKLQGADALDVKSDLPLTIAWQRVCALCSIDTDTLAAVVASAFRTTTANLSAAEPTATKLLPASIARKHMVFPIRDRERYLVIATANPTDPDAESAVGFASGRMPQLEIAPPEAIERAIEAAYSVDGAVESILRLVGEGDVRLVSDTEAEKVSLDEIGSPPVVRLTNAIISEAIRQGASDIHLQPTPNIGVVRNRVDGVLRNTMQVPLPVMTRVISRIKILSKLDITEHMRPQDGSMRVAISDRNYDLRVSTVPTRGAEKCVIRILDTQASKTLSEIGLPARELELLRKQLKRRDGIVVVSGPTGSGKTTTLYAALGEIATEDLNAMTVEDPVEYELAGLTQIPIESKRGVTFASALRAILRQDPDVIFVGEIRDAETADVTIQASLTGHLVLTTLHTNDALGAIRRLSDLGVDPAAITQTLRASLAQRLIRRVCPDCAKPIGAQLTTEENRLEQEFGTRPTVRAIGCDRCADTGYRGRLPVVELFVMSPEVERLVLAGAASTDVSVAAIAGGMRTLRDSALERVRAGETTLEEVERVVGEKAEGDGSEPAKTSIATTAAASAKPEEDASPSVLVVDDDSANRLIARALLDRAGYKVVEAENGEQAWELISARPFHLVVLDLDMPRMGGREVLKKMRSTPATSSILVIVLTGTSDPESEMELLEQGADDYMRKPMDPNRFLSRVKAALRRAQG